MPTIYQQLDELTQAHDNIRTALVNKGVTDASTHGFTQFASDVSSIQYDTTAEDGLITRTLTSYSNDRVTSIGDYAFYNELTLQSLSAPNVTEIGLNAFNRSTISNFNGDENTLYFPNLSTVGDNCFYAETGITKVVLPELLVVKRLCFDGCSNVISVELPKCTEFRYRSFAAMTSLQWISFDDITAVPTSVSTIPNTFTGSTNLAAIYVPTDLVDATKAAWPDVANIIYPITDKPV